MMMTRIGTDSRCRGRAAGFTLVELLVVVGIIMLLVGISIGVIAGFKKYSEKAVNQAFIDTLEMAIGSYQNDMGVYPASSAQDSYYRYWSGCGLLYQALIGGENAGIDGRDGEGFRLIKAGDIKGPYIDTSKLKSGMEGRSSRQYPVFLDLYGNPVMYYRFKANATTGGDYIHTENRNNLADREDAISDIRDYAKRGTGVYLRSDYLLCTKGPDKLWWPESEFGDPTENPEDDDDVTNLPTPK